MATAEDVACIFDTVSKVKMVFLVEFTSFIEIKQLANADPTDKLLVGMVRHRLEYPRPHVDAATSHDPRQGGNRTLHWFAISYFLASTLVLFVPIYEFAPLTFSVCCMWSSC